MNKVNKFITALVIVYLLQVYPLSYSQGKGNSTFVGTTGREYFDSTRSNWLGTGPRSVSVILWFPSNGNGTAEDFRDGDDNFSLTRDGGIDLNSSKYPLIILSHGSHSKASHMFWLGHYLSSHGYITATVDHNGSPEEEKKWQMPLSDFCHWERPRDISFVINSIISDSVFGPHIDTARIGAAGFSLGGAAVIWAAGAIFNPDSLAANSPAPPPQLMDQINRFIELSKTEPIIINSIKHSRDSFKDKRIKAVFSMSPAIGAAFPAEDLRKIDLPVMIVAGDKDIINPVEFNAKKYAEYIPNSSLTILRGELGHYTKPVTNSERKKDFGQVSKMALEFFNKHLTK